MTLKRRLRLGTEPLINAIGLLLSYIFSYRMVHLLSEMGVVFHTAWIRRHFRHLGKGCIIKKGITLKGAQYISIGEMTAIHANAVLTAWKLSGNEPSVSIGHDCDFGEYLHLSCTNRIVIGSGVLTGRWVTIVDNSHGTFLSEELKTPPHHRPIVSKGTIRIGDNVWLGDKVTVLPGVTIGQGSIIASNSVVTKDIPENSIAAGAPAKVVRQIEEIQGNEQ